jgi:hypothetical protein
MVTHSSAGNLAAPTDTILMPSVVPRSLSLPHSASPCAQSNATVASPAVYVLCGCKCRRKGVLLRACKECCS